MPILATSPEGSVFSRPRTKFLWVRFVTRDGKEVRKSSGTQDLKDAKRFLTRELKASGEVSFKAACNDFFETRARGLKPNTLIGYESNMRTIAPVFGKMTLAEITKEKLKAFVSQRRREVGDVTIRANLAFLSTIYGHAVRDMPNGPAFNPVPAAAKGLKHRPRDRWLRVEEYERLLTTCKTDMQRWIVETASHTGMRTGELLALRKHHLRLDFNEVILPGSLCKNGKPRVVVLSEHAVRTLREVCRSSTGDLVFWHYKEGKGEVPFRSFVGFWRRMQEESGLEDFVFHDLRHTFASWWVQNGGALYPLMKILGHGSLQMVQRYAYLDTAATHREIQKIYPHTFSTPAVNVEDEPD